VAMKDGCDPITSAKLALQLGATQLGHAQLGGPQAGGAQPCGARLDVGLIDGMPLPSHARAVRARGREDCRGELREGHIRVEWRMGGECGNAISVG